MTKGTLGCITKLAGKVAVAVADGNVKLEEAVGTELVELVSTDDTL